MFVVAGTAGAGESSLPLPLLERSAASAALGAGGALLTGVDALGVNPAGFPSEKREFSAQYQQLPLDIGAGGARAGIPLKSLGVSLGVSYSMVRSGSLEKRSDSQEVVGSFSSQDQLVGIHLAGPLPMGGRRLGAGVSVKAMESKVDSYSGTGFAFDAGVKYRMERLPLSIAVAALNVGQGPTLKEEASDWPTSYDVTAAYELGKPLALVGGVSVWPNDDLTTVSVGAQYTLADRLILRGRYAVETGPEAVAGAGLSELAGGVGLRLGAGTLDYTFKPFSDDLADAGADGSHLATLTLRF
jgi:hypothetical protein